eukprot:jgi/Bigna1/126342/aug1.2_g1050
MGCGAIQRERISTPLMQANRDEGEEIGEGGGGEGGLGTVVEKKKEGDDGSKDPCAAASVAEPNKKRDEKNNTPGAPEHSTKQEPAIRTSTDSNDNDSKPGTRNITNEKNDDGSAEKEVAGDDSPPIPKSIPLKLQDPSAKAPTKIDTIENTVQCVHFDEKGATASFCINDAKDVSKSDYVAISLLGSGPSVTETYKCATGTRQGEVKLQYSFVKGANYVIRYYSGATMRIIAESTPFHLDGSLQPVKPDFQTSSECFLKISDPARGKVIVKWNLPGFTVKETDYVAVLIHGSNAKSSNFVMFQSNSKKVQTGSVELNVDDVSKKYVARYLDADYKIVLESEPFILVDYAKAEYTIELKGIDSSGLNVKWNLPGYTASGSDSLCIFKSGSGIAGRLSYVSNKFELNSGEARITFKKDGRWVLRYVDRYNRILCESDPFSIGKDTADIGEEGQFADDQMASLYRESINGMEAAIENKFTIPAMRTYCRAMVAYYQEMLANRIHFLRSGEQRSDPTMPVYPTASSMAATAGTGATRKRLSRLERQKVERDIRYQTSLKLMYDEEQWESTKEYTNETLAKLRKKLSDDDELKAEGVAGETESEDERRVADAILGQGKRLHEAYILQREMCAEYKFKDPAVVEAMRAIFGGDDSAVYLGNMTCRHERTFIQTLQESPFIKSPKNLEELFWKGLNECLDPRSHGDGDNGGGDDNSDNNTSAGRRKAMTKRTKDVAFILAACLTYAHQDHEAHQKAYERLQSIVKGHVMTVTKELKSVESDLKSTGEYKKLGLAGSGGERLRQDDERALGGHPEFKKLHRLFCRPNKKDSKANSVDYSYYDVEEEDEKLIGTVIHPEYFSAFQSEIKMMGESSSDRCSFTDPFIFFLLSESRKINGAFQDEMSALFGPWFHRCDSVKKLARCREKVKMDYMLDQELKDEKAPIGALLGDTVRCLVECPTPDDVVKAMQILKEKATVLRIKNGFLEKDPAFSYRQILANVRQSCLCSCFYSLHLYLSPLSSSVHFIFISMQLKSYDS